MKEEMNLFYSPTALMTQLTLVDSLLSILNCAGISSLYMLLY